MLGFGKNKNPPVANRRPPQRTPAGTKPFSYYASRTSADKPAVRLKKEVRKGLRWQLVPSIIAAVVIVGSLVYASILDTNPRLKVEASSGSVLLQDESVYVNAAQKYLRGSLFNRSKLLINTKNIEDRLLADFPELKTVGVTIPLTDRRPLVAIKPVEPRLQLATAAGSFIIDHNGRAARQTTDSKLAATLKLPVVQDQTGLQVSLGRITLTAREAAFIGELNHQLVAKKQTIESITLPALPNELHVRLKGQGYFIKFNMLDDPRQQAGALLATQDRLRQGRLKPRQYIDVRVAEKVFYK